MQCPRCGQSQPPADECNSCGVIIAKALRATAAPRAGAHASAAGQATSAPKQPRAGTAGSTLASPRPLTARVRLLLLRELGVMMTRGVDLREALEALKPALRRGAASRGLASLRASIDRGATLSAALGEAGADPVEVALIEASEQSGHVGAALGRLAARLQIEIDTISGLRRAMIQPMLLALSAAVLLPAPLAVQESIPAFLRVAALGVAAVIAIAIAVGWGLPRLLRRPAWRGALLALAVWVPGLAQLVRLRRMALLFGAFGPALDAGLPLDLALELAGRATAEPRVERAIAAVRDQVRHHGGLAAAFMLIPGIDEASLARLASGEISGALAEVTLERADTFAHQLSAATASAATVLRIIAGGIVTIIVAVGVMTQMSKAISDPFSMMPAAQRSELERELERAMPHKGH